MSSVGQIYYNVNGETSPNNFIIYDKDNPSSVNIVTQYGGETCYFIKLGIQAPAGTQFVVNEKKIMVGRTGIYELDDDIQINSLYFVPPKIYELDIEQTNLAEQNGIAQINSAVKILDDTMKDTNLGSGAKQQQCEVQINALQEGNALLSKGLNGIYVANTEVQNLDLENIIIDFLYETN